MTTVGFGTIEDLRVRLLALPPGEPRRRLVRELRERATAIGTPLLEGTHGALFLYFATGAETAVGLLGDMTQWASTRPMERVEDTELFTLWEEYEPDARLEYCFVVDGHPGPLQDPLNRYVVFDGLGGHSELAMPEYSRREVFAPFAGGIKGGYERVRRYLLPAGVLPYERELHVYLPPGYDMNDRSYPCVYLQDGRDYIEFAHTPHALDAMIRAGAVEPLVCVFISPPHRHQPDIPNRATEYGLNREYVRFCCDELVPWVGSHFRVEHAAGRRLIAGASFGGLISLATAFSRPEVFANVCCQSSYFSFRDDELRHRVREEVPKPVRLFCDTGTYEREVGASFIPERERDFLEGNRRMRDALHAKGYDVEYREYHEGHTWGNWRAHLLDAIRHFFGTGN